MRWSCKEVIGTDLELGCPKKKLFRILSRLAVRLAVQRPISLLSITVG